MASRWLSVGVGAALLALAGGVSPASAQCAPATPCAGPLINLGVLGLQPGYGGQYVGWSSAYGVSADGSVVVGVSTIDSDHEGGGYHAFRWVGGTMTGLGTLGGSYSEARAVSADGSVVVGTSYRGDDEYGSDRHAFRWVGGTMTGLGTLGGSYSEAHAVSADGSVVVGWASIIDSQKAHAFRWTQGGGMVGLGTLGGNYSAAYGVNADGSVVVGSTTTETDITEAFRWTQATGMVGLGTLGGNYSAAYGVNADGSVVVGSSYLGPGDGSDRHAFRWTQGGGMVSLGTLGGYYSEAYAVSANGAVVVGQSVTSDYIQHAFRWTQATGMANLHTLLAAAGVDMTGIYLNRATGVSTDGQFIVGTGHGFPEAGGYDRAYLVRYDDGAGGGETPIAGVTSSGSVQDSVNNLSNAHAQTMIHQHGFAGPLLGGDKPMGLGSEAGMFASAGSFSGGGHARYASANGVTLLGGIAYARENYATAELKSSVIGAIAMQYVADLGTWWRPFAEAGGWLTANADMTFERSYANGAGIATGIGDTSGDLSYFYGRAGVVFAQSPSSQFVLSGEIGRERLKTSAYAEPDGPQNPFPAVISGGTDRMNVAKIRLQASHSFDQRFDGTLSGAWAHGFDRRTDLTATVLAFGTVRPDMVRNYDWFEYGARLGYKLTEAMTLDVFANGVSGEDGIGTKIHAGAGLRVRF
ncbi:hypothetical protein [Thermomonas sp.]|uniref:hypothetical protein n=1 Tax=Thermomonas sp. TaxID=1971895 RepID=UPI002621F5EC|nr:hypothetical protein [Thermomonas sp.]